MGHPTEYGAKIPVHIDTSKPLNAYALKEGGRSFLQTEELLFHNGFDDYRVKKFLSKDAPPEVSYSLGVGIAPTKWVHDNSQPHLLDRTSRNLLENTELSLTNDGVVFAYQGEELFTIAHGMIPEVRVKERAGERVIYEPDKSMFSFNFDLKSEDPGMPDVTVSMGMVYDLNKIQTGYIYDNAFDSDAFYDQVRPGLNAFIIIT